MELKYFSSKESLLLAYKYGVGCLDESRRKVVEDCIRGKQVDEESFVSYFPTAFSLMLKVAKNKKIDEEIVRKYFNNLHNKIAEVTGREDCKTYKCKVIEILDENSCLVENKNKKEKVIYFDKINVGEDVIVHKRYVVEHV
jgi:hypothetical protein